MEKKITLWTTCGMSLRYIKNKSDPQNRALGVPQDADTE